MKYFKKLKDLALSLDCDLEVSTLDNSVTLYSPKGSIFIGNDCSRICSTVAHDITIEQGSEEVLLVLIEGLETALTYTGDRWWDE